MERGDDSSTSTVGIFCPYSRLPYRTRPEWTNVHLGGDHKLTVTMIGEQIIFSRPTGFVREAGAKATTNMVADIVDSQVPSDLPYIWITDYSGISGITAAGRKFFASKISGLPRLRGLTLFGLSPFLSGVVELGSRLNMMPFPLRTVRTYQQAIDEATSMLRDLEREDRSRQSTPTVLADPKWKLDLDGYSIRFEVVNSSILHSIHHGQVKEEHLDPVFELREEVLRESGLKGRPFSILAGLDSVERSSHAGRLGYVRRMALWYEENPFDVEVFYGSNALMRSVIKVTSHLAPFKVHVVKTYEEGLDFISNLTPIGTVNEPRDDNGLSTTGRHTEPIPPERIDELLKVLGAISWGAEEDLNLEGVDPSDPLAQVYEAIGLIKVEIEDLLNQQKRDGIERRRLQRRLARAEKMEALGLLAGGVAHDLNNILSGIVSYPELLLMDKDLGDQTRRAIETIKKSGDQAAAVVKDLMAISRGAAIKTQGLFLSNLVKEYLNSPDFAAVSMDMPGVTVCSRFDEEVVRISGSPVHLRNLVANLVSNAFESFGSDTHNGIVDIETFQQHVGGDNLSLPDGIPAGNYVVLRVADNGSGVAEEHRDRIFEPFFTRKVVGRSGTGLGLTVVWNTVKNHGGFIDFRSGDSGTRFDVYFPVSAESLLEKVQRVPLESLMGSGERILVVDDVGEQRKITTSLLEALEYQVESVSSGEAAIVRLRHERFDIVLMDMLMEPGLNGREAYEKILEFCPEQRAIIASGFSQDEEVRRFLALGAGAFLAKPYSIEEIGLAVQEVLAGPKPSS